MAPEARASEPCRVPAWPRSVMIRASIGNAVMASATPTNAAETPSETPGARIGSARSVASTSSAPSTSGTETPASETAPAVPASRPVRSRVNAYPAWNMKSTRPIWPTT